MVMIKPANTSGSRAGSLIDDQPSRRPARMPRSKLLRNERPGTSAGCSRLFSNTFCAPRVTADAEPAQALLMEYAGDAKDAVT